MQIKTICVDGIEISVTDSGEVVGKRVPFIKQCIDKAGYCAVNIKGKRFLVHRLVARAFLNNFTEDCHVHHIDENKGNNNVDNLICMSMKEHQHMHKQIYPLTKICAICGKEFTPNKTKRKRAVVCSKECWKENQRRTVEKQKVKIEQLDLNGNVLRVWDSFSEIEKVMGYFSSDICKCCNGIIHTYKGYVWRYNDRSRWVDNAMNPPVEDKEE